MSALRPHIRAARAYEAAYAEIEKFAPSRYVKVLAVVHRIAHRHAAEILEAEQAAEYAGDGIPHHPLCSFHKQRPCDYDCARDGVGEGR